MTLLINISRISSCLASRSLQIIRPNLLSTCNSCNIAQNVTGKVKTGPLFVFSQQRLFSRSAPSAAKEYDFSYTGDAVEEPPAIDESKPRPGFEEAFKLLGDQDVDVKRILSLEFADTKERQQYMLKQIREALGSKSDDSLEENVAKVTIQMRSQMKHMRNVKKDQRVKHHILCRKNHRTNLLNDLRRLDKEAYQWIIKEFGIEHHNPKPKRHWKFGTSRREKRIHAAKLACRALKKAKLDEIKNKLAAERETFDVYKKEEMPQIIKEMQDLGLDLSGSVDDVLESIGLKRVNQKILSKRELKLRQYNKMMVKFGKVREQQEIRGLLPARPESG